MPPLVVEFLAEYLVSRGSVFESVVVRKSGTGTAPLNAGLWHLRHWSTFYSEKWRCSPQSVVDLPVAVLNHLVWWVLKRVGLRKSVQIVSVVITQTSPFDVIIASIVPVKVSDIHNRHGVGIHLYQGLRRIYQHQKVAPGHLPPPL